MPSPEQSGNVPHIQEAELAIRKEITDYIFDAQSLFSAIPNFNEIRLTDPQGKIYSLIPTIDPEKKRWTKIRIEPRKITAEEPYSFSISPEDVVISLASINRDQIRAEQMKPLAERFAIAKTKIESLLAPIRAAKNSTTEGPHSNRIQ